ncbi:hypothetical protein PS896_05584 [Pseudomonas fluorescens]|jgi:uncharacterized protein (TIGR02646 family)|uniref:HNH nuclease domain-containing protein n=1 Tax=Pseudomonas fluorescens TaxID=294 RepID=A0A5E7PXY7_PSEFL|nr:hypothetical protein [Pseudomonas fluorescens]VVP54401.1 hypothetical protein PS896_05584 [Pseudomonas fluorescens]
MTSQTTKPRTLTNSTTLKHNTKRHERLSLLRELRQATKAHETDVWERLSDIKNTRSKELKAMLRKSLKARQGPRCCYCKRWLLNSAHASPIEHILPRHYYPQFALRARNLAIACNDCNALKTDDDWGSFGPHLSYPSPSAMIFFHPRYHSYDEHVRYLRIETNRQELVTYQGLTPQGRHLCSELLSKVVGKQNLRRNYPQLTHWLQTIDEFDTEHQSQPRPALEVFREAMDKILAERLHDSDKASAFWLLPDRM